MKTTRLVIAALALSAVQLTAQAKDTNLRCKDVPQKDEMHGQTVCTFARSSLDSAYQAARARFKEDGVHLRAQLPVKRLNTTHDSVSVLYQPSRKKYQIDLGYPGGETIWKLYPSAKQVKIVIDYYPD